MTSRFSALPLGSGEAFLLQTEHEGKHWTVLVDSGNLSAGTHHPLIAAIDNIASNLRRIDVAICTHHDMDHARGFQSFADAWCSTQREIGEFWLPGRWSAAIPAVLFDPLEVAQRIWNGALKVSKDCVPREGEEPRRATREEGLREAARRMQIHSAFSDLGVREEPREFEDIDAQESEPIRINRLARSLGVNSDELQALEISIEETNRPSSTILRRMERQSHRWFDPFWLFTLEGDQAALAISLFWEALETAKTIAAIAESAVRWRIPIRWFDFGQFEP
jgi:Metallo-beta-lactamase superfamily